MTAIELWNFKVGGYFSNISVLLPLVREFESESGLLRRYSCVVGEDLFNFIHVFSVIVIAIGRMVREKEKGNKEER